MYKYSPKAIETALSVQFEMLGTKYHEHCVRDSESYTAVDMAEIKLIKEKMVVTKNLPRPKSS